MDAVDKFWMMQLKRDQLPDLVQGRVTSSVLVGRDEMHVLSPAGGSLIAIWRARTRADFTPLPQIILGETATLGDLFAWSASYLRGIGPLTAHCRVLTPEIFQEAVRPRLDAVWARLAGAAVGAVFGEVLMHALGTTRVARITEPACRSTLSFALMRAVAIGMPLDELPRVAMLWEEARRLTGQTATTVPTDEISEAVLCFARAKLKEPGKDSNDLEGWFLALLYDDGSRRLLQRIGEAFGLLPRNVELESFSRLTAEERVKALDELAPAILLNVNRTFSEKAFALALVTYVCRSGLPQQFSLLGPYAGAAPQSFVWLGLMQGASAFTDTLAEVDGLGWRIARDLFQPPDVFGSPSSDMSFLEMTALGHRARERMISALAKPRIHIELLPNVSTYVRIPNLDVVDQQKLPFGSQMTAFEPDPDTGPKLFSDELLADAESALAVLSRLLRVVRSRTPSNRTSDRKRRT